MFALRFIDGKGVLIQSLIFKIGLLYNILPIDNLKMRVNLEWKMSCKQELRCPKYNPL